MNGFNVETIRIAVFQKGEGAIPHQHEYYQMYHIISGSGFMRLGEGMVEIRPNFVVLISPGVKHGVCEILGESPLRLLNVQFLLDDKEIEERLQETADITSVPPALLDLLWKVKLEWNSTNLLRREMTNGIFMQYFIEYLRANQDVACQSDGKSVLAAVDISQLSGVPRMIADYIQVHYSANISLETMAEDMAYSKNYLCRAFKKATGITIINYINRFRIAKALELIRCTDKKLIEINDMVGFNDFHYFSRVFKSVTGYSPGEMRNRERFAIYLENQGSRQTKYRYYNCENGGI